MRNRSHVLLVALFAAATVIGVPSAAGADVVTVGDCHGEGTWTSTGNSESSRDLEPGDVVKIPRKDTVQWSGALDDHALGDEVPRRDIDGSIDVKILGKWITVDDWGGSSVRAANEGEYEYDLPPALAGVKIEIRGIHRDDGVVTCKGGDVFLLIRGKATDNPLTWVGGALFVVGGAGMVFAGRPRFRKTTPAYEDVNPGLKRRGHPIIGAIAGFFCLLGMDLLLITTATVDVGNMVLGLLPILGIIVGLVIGLVAPFGRAKEPEAATA